MKITCISVGKKHDKYLADAIGHYEKRLKPFCDFEWQLIPPSSVDVESTAVQKTLKSDDYVILFDEDGSLPTNNELADKLESLQNASTKRLVLIIGGSYGVNYQLIQRVNETYSLSNLVFPHQLVRLIIVEQLYRSFSILAGTGYHHD